MNKLELAIDAARNYDIERVIKLLEEALGYCIDEGCPHHGTTHECTNPLAEQAEQEPVAWVWLDDWLNDGYPEDCFSRVNHQNKTPLYATPVRTKDLTDDEIKKVWNKKREIFSFARAVIAADREKNR